MQIEQAPPLGETAPPHTTIAGALRTPLHNVVAGRNPRRHFDRAALEELKEGIRAVGGLLQPLVLRPLSNGQFEIIAGERRARALRELYGDDYEVPYVVADVDDIMAATMAIIENAKRSPVSPAEEAEACAELLGVLNGNRDEVARRLGMSRATVDSRLALMNASKAVRDALVERKIDLGHAELLATLPRAKQDDVLFKLLAQPKLPTVEACKSMLLAVSKALAAAIFDRTDCAGCNHNSEVQGTMFGEALDKGYCTNPQCYDGKTEARLIELRDGLEGEFPRREIVRPGDNYTVIRLVAEGPKGVGTEQAQACRACANFGAAVMGTPDALGRIVTSACFDPVCNTRMVAKRMKAEAASAANAATASKAATAASANPGPKAPLTEVQLTGQVLDYRKRLWRNALRSEIRASPRIGLRMIIAGSLCGQARNVHANTLIKALEQQYGNSELSTIESATPIGRVLALVEGLSDEDRRTLTLEVAAQMVEEFTDDMVAQALIHFQVDLRKHFTLDEDLLNKLTKSEIEVLAKELGLDKALRDDFKKLLGLKKDELIKKVLSAEGFDYHSVPRFLAPSTKATADAA